MPEVTDGRIPRHQGVAVIEETVIRAYDCFANAAREKTLKVLLSNDY